MRSRRSEPPAGTPSGRSPSVLVVLVVKDGEPWLRACLASLSRQTHARLGVIAVDNASIDDSRDILLRALGPERVLSLTEDRGFPGAVRAALEMDVAERADYLLLLHDDVALEPEAVARLVEAALRIDGVGVVGPKVVDWDDPRVLREVGLSTDRFGYPYSPLEDGEIDHGQYDGIREVLFVSSCAMLVSRAAWARTGPPDERLVHRFEDLDFCWRARLAGFRVLMSPLAVAHHRGATQRGDRAGGRRGRYRSRYFLERGALAAMLKNYGLLTLVWVLPLYAVQGLGKVVLLTVSRRFEDVWQILAGWGWNLVRLPGTVRRRARAQAVRAVPDRAIRRFMAPSTLRLRRWGEIAARILLGRGEGPDREDEGIGVAPIRSRAASIARDHPVALAWVLAAVVGALAFRHLIGPDVLQGGALPAFPDRPSGFFQELASGVRTTGLGGDQAASPALALLGALSGLLLGGTALAQKVVLAFGPILAGITFYRALSRRTGQPGAAVVGAGCYVLSALMLWAFSEGRIGVLALMVVLPPLSERLAVAFGARRIDRPLRFMVGTGVVLAVGGAFWPGVGLSFALLLAVHLLLGAPKGRRVRGTLVSLGAAAVAGLLLFPLVVDLAAGSGKGLASSSGVAEFSLLVRLAPGSSPGDWIVSWFLPAAALVAFALVEGSGFRPALRHLLAAAAALFLAWGAAGGHIPEFASNAPSYLAVAALGYSAVVSFGLSSAVPALGGRAFGARQLGVVALATVLGAGLVLQSAQAARGAWDTGPNGLPPAWPVVAAADPGQSFRVLWLGRESSEELPPPAGDPDGAVTLGASSLRYAIGGRAGASALDIGRPAEGEGYRYLEEVLSTVLAGTSRHAGALLSPLAVRYIVAADGDLPEGVMASLDRQLDLDLIPAGGLVIFRNAAALPRAAVVRTAGFADVARASNQTALPELPPATWAPLRRDLGGFRSGVGEEEAGYAFVAEQFTAGWMLEGPAGSRETERAFGWAIGAEIPDGSRAIVVRYSAQRARTLQVLGLGLLWLAALWITRKPARRAESRGGPAVHRALAAEVPAPGRSG